MAAPSEVVFAPTLGERLCHPPPDTAAGPTTRWTLHRIQEAVPTLRPHTLIGIWRLLHRHRIRLRHGRPQRYSPDPAYQDKRDRLVTMLQTVARSEGRCRVLFLDEFTLYHWPLVAADWRPCSGPPPLAQRAPPGERKTRIVGALDGQTGAVHTRRDSAIGKEVFARFLADLCSAYPNAERVYVVLDNWPVHHSPEVAQVTALGRLELVFLPTYAPWLNPIEKLWDWLKDAVLRLHQRAGQWPALKREALAFLDRFTNGSDHLLRRVGLVGDGLLAQALIPHLENQT